MVVREKLCLKEVLNIYLFIHHVAGLRVLNFDSNLLLLGLFTFLGQCARDKMGLSSNLVGRLRQKYLSACSCKMACSPKARVMGLKKLL